MLVQAVAGKANGLPITLLELNTIMHMVCALWMYLLWLKKPQDVRTATIIYDNHKIMALGTLLSIKDVKKEPPEERHTGSHILRWKDGVFELGPGSLYPLGAGVSTWVQRWYEAQAARKLCADYRLICHSDGTETHISSQDNIFLTHQKAQFLVDYCIGRVPTFGKSKLSGLNFARRSGEWVHREGKQL